MSSNMLVGIVKQVLSGDKVKIRNKPTSGPPKEKTILLSNITAPKLIIKKKDDSKEEPYAWEAREFLRKKLIGQEVFFTLQPSGPESSLPADRGYGNIYFPTKDDNIIDELVKNGLVNVKQDSRQPNPEIQRLAELEQKAKTDKKGKWSTAKYTVRTVTQLTEKTVESFVKAHLKKSINAIIEGVQTGSTVQALLLPDFYSINLFISGIRCDSPADELGLEAKFFVECRLLQQEVQIIVEGHKGTNIFGSIIHPKGDIAEVLLKEGFASCVDATMVTVTNGAEKLRAAEKYAKEKHLRKWRSWEKPSAPKIPNKEFQGIVSDIIGGEQLVIRLPNGEDKKIFLASIRPPRVDINKKENEDPNETKPTIPAPQSKIRIFDVPWFFEAREYLRKKLIGKKVSVVVDYIQEARDSFPERYCCTVTIGGLNVAEGLVSEGLATVVQYRQEDYNRSSHYDALVAAQQKALEKQIGIHSKEIPKHRVNDLSGDPNRAKGLLPIFQRASKLDAIVEYVASGSRMRLYIPRELTFITFLLAGIICLPSKVKQFDDIYREDYAGKEACSTRPIVSSGSAPYPFKSVSCRRPSRRIKGEYEQGEKFGDEALQFTRDRIMLRNVEIKIQSCDRAGNMIGWLFVNSVNLSIALVEEGLAEVHSVSADRSEYYRPLTQAEESAKAKRLNIWAEGVTDKKIATENDSVERTKNYKSARIEVITPELHVYVQYADKENELVSLQQKLRSEINANPPPSTYRPKRGERCAAKFVDGEWYRAKVQKLMGPKAQILYTDYGNTQEALISDLAPLPYNATEEKPFAHEFALACVKPPPKEYIEDAIAGFHSLVTGRLLSINTEYNDSLEHISIVDFETKEDLVKKGISEGYFLVDKRSEKKLQQLIEEYEEGQKEAKLKRLQIWQYGDVTDDDAKEFGFGK